MIKKPAVTTQNKQLLKLAMILFGAMYCVAYFLDLPNWHFIDYVDLVIHEAGHVVFMFFGTFMHILGGSLLQILMPVLFTGYFFGSGQTFSALFCMEWTAINFFNVGQYAADAQAMALPLLGGDSSGHDWHNLLSMTGLLPETKLIAGLIYLIGFGLLGFAVFLAIVEYKNQT